MKGYDICVKKGPFWRKFRATGHSVTNAVQRRYKDAGGKEHVDMDFTGPLRLEIWLEKGGVVVYGDVSKINYRLGNDWFDVQTKQVENESGGVVKLSR